MHPQDPIELAKNYVALSNDHDLQRIRSLFATGATYYSAYFGEYRGSDAIHAMMTGFFTRFSDAHWEAAEYRCIEDHGVEFAFVMTGLDTSSGERVERQGLERIYFAADGLIRRIVVCRPDEQSLIRLKQSLHIAEQSVLALKYNPAKLNQIAALALACNCLEIAHAACHLSDLKAKAALPILIRSLLECALRSAYLARNPEIGIISLEYMDNLELIKFHRKRNSKPALVKELERRNKIICKLGAKKNSFENMLTQLGINEWYPLYMTLSNFTHGNLTGLSQQFFTRTEKGAQIEYHKHPDEKILLAYYSATEQLLQICVDSTLQMFAEKT